MDTFTQTIVTRLRANGSYERFQLDSSKGEVLNLDELHAGIWSITQLVDGRLVTSIFPVAAFIGARVSQEPVATPIAETEPVLATA